MRLNHTNFKKYINGNRIEFKKDRFGNIVTTKLNDAILMKDISFDYEEGWNGIYKDKVCQDGVYGWRIQYGCGEEIKVKIGIVSLLR